MEEKLGRYTIVRPIRRGSMGVVYEVVSDKSEKFALKTFLISDAATKEEEERKEKRLAIEARRAMKLDHPNIVRTYDYYPGDGQTPPYIVMEYIDGQNLDQYLKNNGRFSPEDAVHLIKLAAEAIDSTTRLGLIHRDIKPANMLITDGGSGLKLIDFGISKRISEDADSSSFSISTAEERLGTLPYMSPEQVADDGGVSERSDQYALACVAYLLLTGRRVIEDTGSDLTKMNAIMHKSPPKPSGENPALNGRVDKVLFKALSKNPAQRFDDCAAFARALDEALFFERGGPPVWQKALAGVAAVALLGAGIWYLVGDNKPNHTVVVTNSVVDPPPVKPAGLDLGHNSQADAAHQTQPSVDPPPPPPDPFSPGTLEVTSRGRVLKNKQKFGENDPDWGTLDPGDIATRFVKPPRGLPPNSTLDWYRDGKPQGSEDLSRTGEVLGADGKPDGKYPDMPLPGEWEIRLHSKGHKDALLFRFTIERQQ